MLVYIAGLLAASSALAAPTLEFNDASGELYTITATRQNLKMGDGSTCTLVDGSTECLGAAITDLRSEMAQVKARLHDLETATASPTNAPTDPPAQWDLAININPKAQHARSKACAIDVEARRLSTRSSANKGALR